MFGITVNYISVVIIADICQVIMFTLLFNIAMSLSAGKRVLRLVIPLHNTVTTCGEIFPEVLGCINLCNRYIDLLIQYSAIVTVDLIVNECIIESCGNQHEHIINGK